MRRRNAAVFLSGRIVALVVLLGFQTILVRVMPAGEYARYAIVIALATLVQTIASFGIPRAIPKYVSQAGNGLHPRTVGRLVAGILGVRVATTGVMIAATLAGAVLLGWADTAPPALVIAGGLYILASVVQVDADAMAQSLALQGVSRAATVGEAVARCLIVAVAAAESTRLGAVPVLALSALSAGIASLVLLLAVRRALATIPAGGADVPFDRGEFRAIALSGYASAMAWFGSSPAVVRVLASRVLPVTTLAGFSFVQTLVLSFQRYTPGMLLFPFVEPTVMKHHAETGDHSRLEAALSLVVKLDVVVIGATVVGTIVAGRPIVELITGGKYGALAFALPWLLVYVAACSIHRAFEIVAVARGAASALLGTFVPSLLWLAAGVLAGPLGVIGLLAYPVGDSISRLGIMYRALRRAGLHGVIDAPANLGVAALIGGWGMAGTLAVRWSGAGPLATIAIGTLAGLLYLASVATARPFRRGELALLASGDGRAALLLRRWARA